MLPGQVEFVPPRPNPGRENVRLEFSLPHDARVLLEVFDVAGRIVRSFAEAPFVAGRHVLVWDHRDNGGLAVPSGVYFVRFQVPGVVQNRKTILIR